jgi:hypothetical protein
MGVLDTIRRWGGAQPQGVPAVGAAGAGAAEQSRRRARAAGDRAALWTEEPETCEQCGRRLLTGEMPALMQREDEQVLVCPICVMDLAAAGFRSYRQSEDDVRRRDAA